MKRRLDSARGIMLIPASFFLPAIAGWIAVGMQRSIVELRASERWTETVQAFWPAEAGVDQSLYWLRTQPAPPPGTQPFNPLGGPQTLTLGQCTANIDPDDGKPGGVLSIISRSTSREKVVVRKPSPCPVRGAQ